MGLANNSATRVSNCSSSNVGIGVSVVVTVGDGVDVGVSVVTPGAVGGISRFEVAFAVKVAEGIDVDATVIVNSNVGWGTTAFIAVPPVEVGALAFLPD